LAAFCPAAHSSRRKNRRPTRNSISNSSGLAEVFWGKSYCSKLLILFGGRGRNRTYNLSVKRGIIKHGTSMLSMEWGGAERSKWSLLGTQFGEEFGEELRLN
jgi:hypothetical protein